MKLLVFVLVFFCQLSWSSVACRDYFSYLKIPINRIKRVINSGYVNYRLFQSEQGKLLLVMSRKSSQKETISYSDFLLDLKNLTKDASLRVGPRYFSNKDFKLADDLGEESKAQELEPLYGQKYNEGLDPKVLQDGEANAVNARNFFRFLSPLPLVVPTGITTLMFLTDSSHLEISVLLYGIFGGMSYVIWKYADRIYHQRSLNPVREISLQDTKDINEIISFDIYQANSEWLRASPNRFNIIILDENYISLFLKWIEKDSKFKSVGIDEI